MLLVTVKAPPDAFVFPAVDITGLIISDFDKDPPEQREVRTQQFPRARHDELTDRDC